MEFFCVAAGKTSDHKNSNDIYRLYSSNKKRIFAD